MKLDRSSSGLLFAAVVGGFVGAFVGSTGCTSYPTYKPNVPIDCDVELRYQLDPTVPESFRFDVASPPDPGWTASDGSPGATMTGVIKAIPDGPRCGSATALVLTADKNNEWGSLFGLNGFATRHESEYEGMSFWARVTDYNSNTGFTILLDDPNTNNPNEPANCATDAGVPPPSPDAGNSCKNYCSDGGTATGNTDPGTGMIIPGTVSTAPEPDQCGNSFTAVRAVTTWWRFYTIPFSEFQQGATPNRVPNGALKQTGPSGTPLRTSDLLNLVFRIPKAMRTELWIDNLGFYRKATATGGDGGVDASQM